MSKKRKLEIYDSDKEGEEPLKKKIKIEDKDEDEGEDIDMDELEFDEELSSDEDDDDGYRGDSDTFFRCDLVLNDAKAFKVFVGVLKQFVDQVNIDITREGVSYCVLDSSHVALIQGVISRSCFSRYFLNKDGVIGLTTEAICDVVDILKLDQPLNIIVESQDKCKFVSYNKKNGHKKVIERNLVSIDSELLEVPEDAYVDCDITLNILSRDLEIACKDMGKMKADVLKICLNQNGLTLRCEDPIKGSYEHQITNPSIVTDKMKKEYKELIVSKKLDKVSNSEKRENLKKKLKKMVLEKYEYDSNVSMILNTENNSDFKISLSLAYIEKLSKAVGKSSKYVSICSNHEQPVQLRYLIEDKEDCFIGFYLAPKVGDEEIKDEIDDDFD